MQKQGRALKINEIDIHNSYSERTGSAVRTRKKPRAEKQLGISVFILYLSLLQNITVRLYKILR